MDKALNTRKNPSISTESLVSLAKLVSENSALEFDGKVHNQKLGTVIGIKFASAYANLFRSSLEEEMSRCEG